MLQQIATVTLLLVSSALSCVDAVATLDYLSLIDTATGLEVAVLEDGGIYEVGTDVPSSAFFSIQAIVTDPESTIAGIRFDYNGERVRNERSAPYSMCGDQRNGNFRKCDPISILGASVLPVSHSVKAIATDSVSDDVFDEIDISFTFVEANDDVTVPVTASPVEAPISAPVNAPISAPVNPPTAAPVVAPAPVSNGNNFVRLVWMDAGVEPAVEAGDIVDGGVYSSASLPSQRSIQAIDTGMLPNVDRFRFRLNGDTVRTDGRSPYSYCGDRRRGTKFSDCLELQFSEGSTQTITIQALDADRDIIDEYEATISFSGGAPISAPVVPLTSAPVVPPTSAPVLPPTSAPIVPPTSAPVMPVPQPVGFDPSLLTGTWEERLDQDIEPRHEACFVKVGSKGYLLGGRETVDVDILDTSTGQWSKGADPPIDLIHHMQCVAVGDQIYLAAAWTGRFPTESLIDFMYVYNTVTNAWHSEDAMPDHRRRGSSAVVVDGTKIWVSHGNIGGHERGDHAVSLGWIDYYDTESQVWVVGKELDGTVVFPDAANPRDHTGGALVNGRICVGGGRDGGTLKWPTVGPTDCYDPVSNTWSVEADIPTPRGGSAYGTSCDGRLVVAGGERPLSGRIDVFDGTRWESFENELIVARHGTSLLFDCENRQVYVPSGSPNGGGGRITSMGVYSY